jgi:hypothetical protein
MNSTTRFAVTSLALAFAAALPAARAAAQEQTPPPQTTPPAAPQTTPPAPAPTQTPIPAQAETPKWGFDLSVFSVNPPDDNSYAATVLRADRGSLHVEGRWNYEALHAASLFVGRTFDWSKQGSPFELSLVPMAGVVVGGVDGVAPGLLLDAKWKWLEFYDESEYLVSTNDHHDNFIYSWSELTLAPVEWLKFGLAAQRTRAYDTELSVDRGPLVSLNFKKVTATVYWFNPDKSHSYVMFTIGFSL